MLSFDQRFNLFFVNFQSNFLFDFFVAYFLFSPRSICFDSFVFIILLNGMCQFTSCAYLRDRVYIFYFAACFPSGMKFEYWVELFNTCWGILYTIYRVCENIFAMLIYFIYFSLSFYVHLMNSMWNKYYNTLTWFWSYLFTIFY